MTGFSDTSAVFFIGLITTLSVIIIAGVIYDKRRK
jgi:hypothetical protein